MRKLESEPATRDVTPVDIPRMNSVPLKKRKVFDGIQVPTFREVSRRKLVQRTETSKNTLGTKQDHVSVPSIPSRSARRKSRTPTSTLPPIAGSDEDDLDWENFRVNVSSGKCNFCIELDIHSPTLLYSEADVDRSLVIAHPSSPPWTQTSTPHGTPAYCRVTHLTQRDY
jgi:hypothetical protein